MDRLSRKFQIAQRSSNLSDLPIRLGAAIFYKNRLVSIGYNCDRSSRMQHEYNKYRNFNPDTCKNSIHAEMAALSNLSDDLDPSKLSIYVYREYKDGQYALAKPCKACEAALRDKGIKKVNYTGYHSLISELYI